MSELEYHKEMERLGIELSWKFSQIEGNTSSLLEMECQLKEKRTASGKTKEENFMIFKHNETLDFIIDVLDYQKRFDSWTHRKGSCVLTKE